MDWEALTKLVVAVVPALAGLIAAARGPTRVRSNLRHDGETLEKLPEGAAKEELLRLVERQVSGLRRSLDGQRNTGVLVMALIATPLLGVFALWLFQRDTWWGLVSGAVVSFLAISCAYGIFESAERVPRDSKGRRIPEGARARVNGA
jgi:hypothetical protein